MPHVRICGGGHARSLIPTPTYYFFTDIRAPGQLTTNVPSTGAQNKVPCPVSVKSAKMARLKKTDSEGREESRVLMVVRPPYWNRTTPQNGPEIRHFPQVRGC